MARDNNRRDRRDRDERHEEDDEQQHLRPQLPPEHVAPVERVVPEGIDVERCDRTAEHDDPEDQEAEGDRNAAAGDPGQESWTGKV